MPNVDCNPRDGVVASSRLLRTTCAVNQIDGWLANRSSRSRFDRERRMERETGIEPATNSLGSCDSTTELLPLSQAILTDHYACGLGTSTSLTTRTRHPPLGTLAPGTLGTLKWLRPNQLQNLVS